MYMKVGFAGPLFMLGGTELLRLLQVVMADGSPDRAKPSCIGVVVHIKE